MEEIIVSVIMPVYNSSRFLDTAIQSILNQTFTQFELIITNDGSTDDSLSIIKNYNDNRIRLINHEINKGLIFTRNEAVATAKGKYIALLDSDDIALPERFEKQVAFLELNPKFGLLGTWIKTIDEFGNVLKDSIQYPAKPEEIPVILLFKNYFTASSVMVLRSAVPETPFEPEFPIAEDYNVWIRIAETYKVWNLPEVLTCYRVHSNNIHIRLDKKMLELEMLQLSKQLSKFQADFTEKEKEFFFLIGKTDYAEEYFAFLNTDIVFADKCFEKLISVNNLSGRYDKEVFFEFLKKRWSQLFVSIQKYNMTLFKNLRHSVFFRNLTQLVRIKFLIKCLIKF